MSHAEDVAGWKTAAPTGASGFRRRPREQGGIREEPHLHICSPPAPASECVTDLGLRPELVKATGGGGETGERARHVGPSRRGCVCDCVLLVTASEQYGRSPPPPHLPRQLDSCRQVNESFRLKVTDSHWFIELHT